MEIQKQGLSTIKKINSLILGTFSSPQNPNNYS
jgi:hypothetical protein